MALAGFALVGRPLAIWPATLQVMPEGVFDAAFGRLFAATRILNSSAQAWPATEVRISARGAQTLAAAQITVTNGWSGNDAAAVGQSASGEWIPVPALAAGAFHTAYLKLDVTKGTTGLHLLELELRDPATPAVTLKASAPLPVARTTCQAGQRTFTSVCDEGTLTTSLGAVTLDQELFRRALKKARVLAGMAALGTRTPAETERLRRRLQGLLCGDESDVCSVLSDLGASCALPTGSLPGPVPPPGGVALLIQSDQAANLADRVKILGGSVFSNQAATIGNDTLVNGDVTAGTNIQIGDRTRVDGDVTAGGVVNRSPSGGSVIVGEIVEGATVAPLTIPTKTVSTGTTNVTVNSGQGTPSNPFPIAPGKYNNITINSNNVIALSPGLYQVVTLVINADVTLRLNQTSSPVDMRVKTNLSFGDRLVVQPGTPAPGVTAQFYSSQTSEVRVGTDIAAFPIVLTAPQGTIHVFSRTNVTALLAGKTVALEPDVTVGTASVGTSSDWVGTGGSGIEFLGYPTGLQLTVGYNGAFFGSTGPLAFGLLPWKALLASSVLQFDLGLPGAVAGELVSIADEAVVGVVKKGVLNATATPPGTPPPPTQAGSVDAAVASVRGNRSLGAPHFAQLDASPNEANPTPVAAVAGAFPAVGFLTNTEISAALNSGNPASLKVHKSGAGTGVTRGIISALMSVVARDDETGTLHFVNQLLIVPDAQAPAAAGKVAGLGDSGSLWVQTSSNKVVAMTHTVGSTGAVASRIQDVINALQIQLA